ncbi:hypothetical protein ACX27_24140 [Nostoc piscinale CENA21]|uniref:Serine kinase n=1 Tax=Nostoc piscinale CENA21 TaxID=224013 RepID=A0A0M5MHV4_9NOSO|nr:hypothetical protein ACX27_24140 [Nostoc piscinale CENA21]
MILTTSPVDQDANKQAFCLENLEWSDRIFFSSYGIGIGIRLNKSTLLEPLQSYLPPIRFPLSGLPVQKLYSLWVSTDKDDESVYRLYEGQTELLCSPDLDEVLTLLENDLCLSIGIATQDWLFIHAGVVAWGDYAIVIPGRSFSGKTTLVMAFLQAGATYYSDEYAVLDRQGLVHPYPRAVSVRTSSEKRQRLTATNLGVAVGSQPVKIKVILQTQYHPQTEWQPAAISTGQAILGLLDNTLTARLYPELTLSILTSATVGSSCFAGQRGEAAQLVDQVLTLLS